MWRPTDVDHLFADPATPLTVFLAVVHIPSVLTVDDPRQYHWALCWVVGHTTDRRGRKHTVHRLLQIVQEHGHDHLTNWGAMTKIGSLDTADVPTVSCPVATLTLEQRRALEVIGEAMPVRVPDGVWNCQDWCISVLEEARKQGLVTEAEIASALEAARNAFK